MTLNRSRKERSEETNRDWKEPIVAQHYPSHYSAPNEYPASPQYPALPQYSAPSFETGRVYEIPQDMLTLASTGAIVPYAKVYGDDYGSSTSDYNCHYTNAGQSSSESERYGFTGVDDFLHSLSPPEPSISFIFAVDNLKMAPEYWHFLPRLPSGLNEPPAWGCQTRRDNFIHRNKSAIYRWKNGVISHATEYSLLTHQIRFISTNTEQLPCFTMMVLY